MSPASLDRMVSHAIRRLAETQRRAEHDQTAQDEVEFWEERVVRLIDKQDETDDA
jgi:hypothetical protein